MPDCATQSALKTVLWAWREMPQHTITVGSRGSKDEGFDVRFYVVSKESWGVQTNQAWSILEWQHCEQKTLHPKHTQAFKGKNSIGVPTVKGHFALGSWAVLLSSVLSSPYEQWQKLLTETYWDLLIGISESRNAVYKEIKLVNSMLGLLWASLSCQFLFDPIFVLRTVLWSLEPTLAFYGQDRDLASMSVYIVPHCCILITRLGPSALFPSNPSCFTKT